MKFKTPFYPLIKNSLLIVMDLVAFFVAFKISIYFRNIVPKIFTNISFPNFHPLAYMDLDLFIFPIVLVFIFSVKSLYQKRRTFWEELLIIWKAIVLSCLLSYLILFNFNHIFPQMSRLVLLSTFILLMIIIPLFRLILKKILFNIGFWKVPVIFVTDLKNTHEIQRIIQAFSKDFYLGFVAESIFYKHSSLDKTQDSQENLTVYNSIDELPKHRTIFFVTDQLNNNLLLETLYSNYRSVYVIPQNMVGLVNIGAQFLFQERMFFMKFENKLNSVFSHLIKNLMDYIFGTIIIIMLSPLFFILGILVKLTSKGPIFYSQKRVGKDGKIFKMWKFRTMYPDADQKLKKLLESDPSLKEEWDKYFKLKNDPRITPIGNFLRKYSLDEFPQLFNVLLGNMSLIGPRPFVIGELESINPSLAPLYAQVKPGLTGLWQVSGRNDTDRLERLQIDVWYLQNWSPSLDILIFLNTPLAVLTARGAR